jgi:hypothetical protein
VLGASVDGDWVEGELVGTLLTPGTVGLLVTGALVLGDDVLGASVEGTAVLGASVLAVQLLDLRSPGK